MWACHYEKVASERMAEKLGFMKVAECFIIKSKHIICWQAGRRGENADSEKSNGLYLKKGY